MTLPEIVSALIGAVVGLIAVAIFTAILKREERPYPKDTTKKLWALIGLVLGSPAADYAIFDFILQANGLFYYLGGFAVIFLPFGLYSFIVYLRS